MEIDGAEAIGLYAIIRRLIGSQSYAPSDKNQKEMDEFAKEIALEAVRQIKGCIGKLSK